MQPAAGTQSLALILIAYNALVFFIYGIDKWKARHGRWRVRESTLLGLAALGGAAGAACAIFLLRHKSRKAPFAVGVPVMLAAQAALTAWLLSR